MLHVRACGTYVQRLGMLGSEWIGVASAIECMYEGTCIQKYRTLEELERSTTELLMELEDLIAHDMFALLEVIQRSLALASARVRE